MKDAESLGKLAHDYAHPKEPVVTSDPTAMARCYFDRCSATLQMTLEEAEEQVAVMDDLDALRKAARNYLHPEIGVTHSDPECFGRNYFTRYSAPEMQSFEEAKEQARILTKAAALKKLAIDYAHPRLPVVTSDPTAMACCYFDRASAPEMLSFEEAEEQAQIVAGAAALKKLTIDYAHPELPVTTSDPTATACCYFDRASATRQLSYDEAEEQARIFAEVAALKKLATDYSHPEHPVITSNPTVTACCYFDRASAPCNLEQIISTSAYAAEKKNIETLEKHMETLEALAPASKTKVVPAVGPHTVTSQSASNGHLFDLEFA